MGDESLPALPKKSVILTGNAKHHSRQTEESNKKPTTKWLIAEIQKWLTSRNVAFIPKETIPLLIEKVKALNISKEFKPEKITKTFCEMNQKTNKNIAITCSSFRTQRHRAYLGPSKK